MLWQLVTADFADVLPAYGEDGAIIDNLANLKAVRTLPIPLAAFTSYRNLSRARSPCC